MNTNFKFTKTFYIFILIFSLMINIMPKVSFAKETNKILYNNIDDNGVIDIIYEDGAKFKFTPLNKNEIDNLLKNKDTSNNTKFQNVITCRPISSTKIKDSLAVEFRNSGVILDRVDYVWTNLLAWQFADNGAVLGYKAEAWRIASFARTEYIKVFSWYKAQTIGGEARDGFGTEYYLGGASSFIYNIH